MKYIITEEHTNEVVARAVIRRMSQLFNTMWEILSDDDIAEDAENYDEEEFIDYIVELVMEEVFPDEFHHITIYDLYFNKIKEMIGGDIRDWYEDHV